MGDIQLLSTALPDLLPMRDRSPGIHVSSIITDLAIRLGHINTYDEDDDPDMSRMQLGCALEDTIAQRFTEDDPNRYVRPGELYHDGLYGTPDLLDLYTQSVVEIKLTWVSGRHDADSKKLWRYWVQCAAYCHMMGWVLGRLIVVFIRGDYKDRKLYAPQWEQRFTKAELQSNWTMLKRNSQRGPNAV